MSKKIICFDVDGTLTDCKSSWVEITNKLELPDKKITEIYLHTEDGLMSFEEGEKQLKEIFLECKDANYDNITRLFEEIPIRNGAEKLFDHLKFNDYLVYLVSGMIGMYVEMVAKKLGGERIFCPFFIYL